MIFLRKNIILAALFVKGYSYLDIDSHIAILCRKNTESARAYPWRVREMSEEETRFARKSLDYCCLRNSSRKYIEPT
jgi:hypothetical protein